jgi:hypothetical protein
LDILTLHLSINVKSPNNISKWHMGINSAFKGLNYDEYGTTILPVVVHGSENWSLTLREEHGQWEHERAFSVGGGEGGVVCGHSGWLGPTGGNMCGKTNVLNEKIFFSPR